MAIFLCPLGCLSAPAHDDLDGAVNEIDERGLELSVVRDTPLAQEGWPIVDTTMESVAGSSSPGCGVAVVEGDRLIFVQVYGESVDGERDWELGTPSPVGPISKTETVLSARLRVLSVIDEKS